MTDFLVYSIAALVVGVGLFTKGFIWMREKKFIEELPTSNVRGLAMGPVEIKGKVEKAKLLTAPFSGEPCVYYKYTVVSKESMPPIPPIQECSQGIDCVSFSIRDKTGAVLVDPREAVIEIPKRYRYVSSLRRRPPKAIAEFCKRVGYPELLKKKKIQYTEWCIKPGDLLYVMGTAGENPHIKDTKGLKNTDDIMIQKGKDFDFFYISNKHEPDVLRKFKSKIRWGIFGGGAMIVSVVAFWVFIIWSWTGII
ncbi:GIDE domain-containing protein [Nanoarchaeota archaeon]